MINREIKKVTYRVFSDTKDKYGQLKKEWEDQEIEMMIKIMTQVNVDDPRFIDCDSVGITKAADLIPGNKIIDGKKVYLIKYIIPSNRFQQALLKCEK